MKLKTWTVTDAERRLYIDELSIQTRDVDEGIAAHFAIHKRRLRGGLCDGVDVIDVDNGRIGFTVLPTRGMGIWRATLGETPFGWQSPVKGPVHPNFVPLAEPSGLGWLDGFDELLCRCGLESNGAPEFDAQGQLKVPLHGRIANRPAQRVDISYDLDVGEIIIRGVVDETRFLFHHWRLTTTIRTRPGESGFRVRDEVTNLSSRPAEFELLYHVNFGPPLLDAGAKLVLPVDTLVPRNGRAAEGVRAWNHYAAEAPGFAEQVYFTKPLADDAGQTQALLKNAHGTLGAALHFNVKQLPCFTLWKNTGALSDGYVTGLEPATNYPNPRSFEKEQKRLVTLKPGATYPIDLQLEFCSDAAAVARAETVITALQGAKKPTIHDKPQHGWCPP